MLVSSPGGQIIHTIFAGKRFLCAHGLKGTAGSAMPPLREVIKKLKKLQLAVNEEKTRICRVPEESFEFLGYTFGRCYSRKTGKAHLNSRPSKRSIKRICDAIGVETGRHTTKLSADKLVKRLNAKLTGWANYFRLGSRPLTARLTPMSIGCASGYAGSTGSKAKGTIASQTSTSTER
jgi:hypothetical protein